ncbi:MAG: hypothetical protein ACTH7W_03555 [Psychrobacter sp.]|uniref:hypothetical protein n=1 Tax=unclassified Psychrobacter TaxID=196806 RepID=UPI0017882996|nr:MULTISPECIES: hypothetical protein [unclassified Psychrobacter]MBE0441600.1 hypothetical protein [Psychrobacter sp. FME13]
MKSFILTSLLSTVTLLTGCQSIQFVDSPIPVTSTPNPTQLNANTNPKKYD